MALSFYAFDEATKEAWHFTCSAAWYRKHDNGHAVSIGFRVPDDMTRAQLSALHATPVSYETWKHSGCQSSCTVRGDSKCSW